MDSKHFGLVAAQQLFQVEDLHYGFWDAGESPTLGKFLQAQTRHTEFLFQYLESAVGERANAKILDSGCGVGVVAQKLLANGYRVDALVPSDWMAQQARERAAQFADDGRGAVFECRFEDYPLDALKEKYAVVYFSESFQYVGLKSAFTVLNQLLDENGKVVIFDFFKKDGVPGKSPLGGGHSMEKFYTTVAEFGYDITVDEDVTENLSPNLQLIHDVLVQRVVPFSQTLARFLSTRYPKTYRIFRFLLRKRLDKLAFKYSEKRNEENFKKYKSYRMIVLQRASSVI
ncbi:MAG: class I SAM-dependent methyltransferase [Pseudomonadota bacterium]